jgi:hypothetical protein
LTGNADELAADMVDSPPSTNNSANASTAVAWLSWWWWWRCASVARAGACLVGWLLAAGNQTTTANHTRDQLAAQISAAGKTLPVCIIYLFF